MQNYILDLTSTEHLNSIEHLTSTINYLTEGDENDGLVQAFVGSQLMSFFCELLGDADSSFAMSAIRIIEKTVDGEVSRIKVCI